MTVTHRSRAGRVSALVAVAGIAGLTACSTPTATQSGVPDAVTGTSAPGSSSSDPGSSTTAAGRRISVTVTGTTITPSPATIPLGVGETLALTITSDHDDNVHAHGFEVEKVITAGVPVTLELTGTLPGVFEVEMHHPALTLLQVAVS